MVTTNKEIFQEFSSVLTKTKFLVGQNLSFDLNIVGCEFLRLGLTNPLGQFQPSEPIVLFKLGKELARPLIF